MKQVHIMGIPFTYTDQKSFVSLLDHRVQEKQKTFVVTANPEIVMRAYDDPGFMDTLLKATYIIADGIGIVKAAKMLKNPLPERVTGFDTMVQLIDIANQKNYRVYLLGATNDTLQKAKNNLYKQYPDLNIVGSHHGYFDRENNAIADEIADLKPDLVFVALGVQKQEQWISENLSSFEQGVFIGVGGSIDVIGGTVKRAPVSWQKLNSEWFYRFLQQPTRWRRMLALPRFALKVLKLKIRGLS